MTTAHKVTITIAIVLALLLVTGSVTATYFVMKSKMETAIASAHSDERQKQIDSLNDGMAKRDQEFAAYKSRAEQAINRVNTPHDVAKAVVQPVGSGGLTFNPFRTYTQTTPDGKTHEVTDVPQENIVPLYKQLGACDLREKDLAKCQADKTDLTASMAIITKDRDDWRGTAKGGSKLRRFIKFAAPIGCGGLAAYATSTVSKNPLAIGVATGGAAAGCSLVVR